MKDLIFIGLVATVFYWILRASFLGSPSSLVSFKNPPPPPVRHAKRYSFLWLASLNELIALKSYFDVIFCRRKIDDYKYTDLLDIMKAVEDRINFLRLQQEGDNEERVESDV